jgi:hypothetical protein
VLPAARGLRKPRPRAAERRRRLCHIVSAASWAAVVFGLFRDDSKDFAGQPRGGRLRPRGHSVIFSFSSSARLARTENFQPQDDGREAQAEFVDQGGRHQRRGKDRAAEDEAVRAGLLLQLRGLLGGVRGAVNRPALYCFACGLVPASVSCLTIHVTLATALAREAKPCHAE